jgi:endonuclease/exonuclease/phosphatase family metal-dependent hydrolase
MTWNVRGSDKPDLLDIAAVIGSYQPDVVALQEVQAGQAHLIGRTLGYQVRWARKHFPYGVALWWRAEGLAVLSPHHLAERRRHLLSPGEHSWTYRRRVALRVQVHLPEVELRVFNVHLASGDDVEERVDQASILAGVIAAERQHDGSPFAAVIAGDLNAHEEPEVMAPLHAARFRDAWESAAVRDGEPGYTSDAEVPSRRLDYVLYSSMGECVSAEVPEPGPQWSRRSDHLPLIVQIRSK